jgi:hypothetical protein
MTVNELINELQQLVKEGRIQDNSNIQVWDREIRDYTSCFKVWLVNGKNLQVVLE